MTERSVADAIAWARDVLAAAGVDSPDVDAQWMAASILDESRSAILANPGYGLTGAQDERYREMVARRATREPLGYVIGSVGFRGLDLEVGAGCLVPRPETEITAERAILHARGLGRRATVVDLGTGCGAIALSVAAEVPEARVFATEISGAARGWALRNLARTGMRVTLLPGDLFDPLHPALGGAVDVVVSNAPYIPTGDFDALPDEVRRFEPREALLGGEDGLDIVMRILEDVPRWLAIGGWLVLETGEEQSEKMAKTLTVLGYTDTQVIDDLAGRPRVVEGRWIGC